MIDEIYNFDHSYFNWIFNKDMITNINKDADKLLKKFEEKYPKEYHYCFNDNKNNVEDYDIEVFNKFTNYQQLLMLTYLSFINDYNADNKYKTIQKVLSCKYLKEKATYVKNKILTEKNVKTNQIYIDSLYLQLKHVNYDMYAYIKYDKALDFLNEFLPEEKEILLDIWKALKCSNNITLPTCMSLEEIKASQDISIIEKEIETNYPRINVFLKSANESYDSDEVVKDFKTFDHYERLIIVDYLSKKHSNITKLEEYQKEVVIDIGSKFKKIIISECDIENDDSDIKLYYRKKFIQYEKLFKDTKTNFISCILDYQYDPNNYYLYQNFLSFYPFEQVQIIQDILIRMKVLNIHSLYYDQILFSSISPVIQNLISVAKYHNKCPVYNAYLNKEFLYWINFFNENMWNFIREIIEVNYQTIVKFIKNFTDKERGIILEFLEWYSLITNNERYISFKEELGSYLSDSKYTNRISDINTKLDSLLSNDLHPSNFIIIADELKESSKEIDYLLEIITNSEDKGNNVPMMIYTSLSPEQRDIVIKVCKHLLQHNYNRALELYLEDFIKDKDTPLTESIYVHVKDSWSKIKDEITKGSIDVNEKCKEKYDQMRIVLDGICGDLFEFCDKCALGNVSLRKIYAIAPIKVEIIKVILECEYLLTRNNDFKKSLDYIKQIKI